MEKKYLVLSGTAISGLMLFVIFSSIGAAFMQAIIGGLLISNAVTYFVQKSKRVTSAINYEKRIEELEQKLLVFEDDKKIDVFLNTDTPVKQQQK